MTISHILRVPEADLRLLPGGEEPSCPLDQVGSDVQIHVEVRDWTFQSPLYHRVMRAAREYAKAHPVSPELERKKHNSKKRDTMETEQLLTADEAAATAAGEADTPPAPGASSHSTQAASSAPTKLWDSDFGKGKSSVYIAAQSSDSSASDDSDGDTSSSLSDASKIWRNAPVDGGASMEIAKTDDGDKADDGKADGEAEMDKADDEAEMDKDGAEIPGVEIETVKDHAGSSIEMDKAGAEIPGVVIETVKWVSGSSVEIVKADEGLIEVDKADPRIIAYVPTGDEAMAERLQSALPNSICAEVVLRHPQGSASVPERPPKFQRLAAHNPVSNQKEYVHWIVKTLFESTKMMWPEPTSVFEGATPTEQKKMYAQLADSFARMAMWSFELLAEKDVAEAELAAWKKATS